MNNGKDKSLESWIWEAACSIRGAKDAPKFKDYRRCCAGSVTSLSVNILSMPDLVDRHLAASVVDEIDDPVVRLPHSIAVGVSGELFGALRPGILCERLNSLDDALTKGLGADCLDFLSS
jgi:hypothetical protein